MRGRMKELADGQAEAPNLAAGQGRPVSRVHTSLWLSPMRSPPPYPMEGEVR
jgi:hypothetical protein